ncbi:hypothetical protein NM688_g5867 [Phlebia brevispora]|uniref:Uncharacterized protein n=1 Tax=Phlebia brevispora TaxID=194682 RepID=A0ACC1SNK4_9APHY|nr:hypothetical protein NM688_g5867 [Phlebia brevispora]
MLLLRDGTLMFLFLSIFSILTQLPSTDVYLSSLTLPVVSIIVCRFLLRLRQVYLSDGRSEPGGTQSLTAPSILVGNLGAPLDFGTAFHQDDVEDEFVDAVLISDDPLSVGLQSF